MTKTATNKSLLILLFNANGLKNHLLELQSVLNNRRIGIALITETHCTPYSNIHIPGYRLHKVNHPDNTAHGGVAILVKYSYIYSYINLFQMSAKIFFNLVIFKFMLTMFHSQLQ